jgi:hypothetical protein
MLRKTEKSRRPRPPRILVPNQQKAIFTVDNQKIIGVVQRLSSTGGSALLMKGPIPKGTLGEMLFGTVFGKVNAHIEFLHRGADGVPLAQAFTFINGCHKQVTPPESSRRNEHFGLLRHYSKGRLPQCSV